MSEICDFFYISNRFFFSSEIPVFFIFDLEWSKNGDDNISMRMFSSSSHTLEDRTIWIFFDLVAYLSSSAYLANGLRKN